EYSVVWWDPGPGGGLSLGARASLGVRRGDLIVKDVPRNVVADGRSRYDRWRLARLAARARGSVPSIVVETMRDRAAAETVPPSTTVQPAEAPSPAHRPAHPALGISGAQMDPAVVSIVDLTADRSGERPGGAGFGLLVHALLARAPFDAGRAALDGLAEIERKMLGLSEEDGGAASALVGKLFDHEVLRAARLADERGACRREVPVTWTLENGTLIEGVVDLAFEHDEEWTVVDYKTDRDLDEVGEDRYRRQVALYASAISRATGRPASAVLIRL
ncbi:MAG TPA: PD-(D/E)XK nuclease family protein, partial [Vicinamibacterales bacterium]|nr:PD-(D/E)XK nuclease family protein [Vicinamibacterales bacterium]